MRFDDSISEILPTKNTNTVKSDIENQRLQTTKEITTVIPNATQNQDGYMFHVDLEEHKQNELGHNALVAYQYSKGVKYSAIAAFFMNLALIFFNSYYVFFTLCALWGYYTTLQFKPSLALSYFVYLLINMLVRTSISIYDCVNQFENNDNLYGGLNVTLTFVLFIMSIYGIRMAWRLYFYLTMCNPEEHIQLRNIRRLNLKALCW